MSLCKFVVNSVCARACVVTIYFVSTVFNQSITQTTTVLPLHLRVALFSAACVLLFTLQL